MSQVILLILGLLVGAAAVVLIFYLRRSKAEEGDSGLVFLQNQLNELTKIVDSRLSESSRLMNESIRSQFGESQKLIKEITQELSSVKDTGRRVESFADQLRHLQDILQNPKQRGVLGEYYLETVLQNVMPVGSYKMQYAFQNGEIVDAVVFVRDKVIPIDSKFSLENYNRILETHDASERERLERAFKQDLKNRIDETSKYVRPSEGTMEFAFMFIPSEGVYYDLLINQVGAVKTSTRDLIEYAFEKKVIIVSPTSFLAYLQTVLQGLKSLQIEEQAKGIQKRVGELGRHLQNYEGYMKKLGTHLGTAVGTYNTAYKELGKVDKDVLRISGDRVGIEAVAVEKPHDDPEE